MKTLFDSDRMTLTQAIDLTASSLIAYAERYRHWVIAYSGGKDSSATATVVAYLIESGLVPAPASLTLFFADTRMELPPLLANAMATLACFRARGYAAEAVLPALDDRFFVYMFGRGVPPPSNTFRWCTEQLKVDPINVAVHALAQRVGEKPLLIIGLRLGESAARDRRIALSCGKNGGECGQGWYQERPPRDAADTLAPVLHWRSCHVWDWLQVGTGKATNPHTEGTPQWRDWFRRHAGPSHGFPTQVLAEVYGMDADGTETEIAARTGCVGCNLASQDFSLQRLLKNPRWAYLEPLRRLKPLYAELKKPGNRLRKDGTETRADGTLVSNPMRLGPLTMAARRWGLAQILDIQKAVNAAAPADESPYLLIDDEEYARILELIEANQWPNRWTGEEPTGDVMLPEVGRDGSVQNWLFGE